MLPFFREKRRGLKWILWLVIVGLGVGMLGLFVDAPGPSSGVSSAHAAEVADFVISSGEFRRHYIQLVDAYRRVYKLDRQDPAIIKQLRLGQQALDQLVAEYATFHEARQMGIAVTSDEIVRFITKTPVFQENGNFIGVDRYRAILRANNWAPQEFEDSIRRQIAREKLRRILTDGIFPTPGEIRREFLNRNQEVKLRYVTFDPEELSPVDVADEELKAYFDERQENYRIGEQRRIRYVSVPVDPENVNVSEEQIRDRMDRVTDTDQVRVSHILVSVGSPDEEPAARAKAQNLLQQLRSGADFAQLAREHSEDPVSAAAGGDLGFFGRDKMMPEFEKAAFALKPGELSDLVITPFGYHIIRGTFNPGHHDGDARRPIAEYEARQQEAESRARELATQISGALAEDPDLAKAASARGLPVEESDYFELGGFIPGLSVKNDFNQEVFDLQENQSLEPYDASGSFLVAQLMEIRPTHMPPFEEIRDKVRSDYRSNQGDESARENAFALHKTIQDGSEFQKLAQERELQVMTTPFFKRGATIDENLRFSPQVHDHAFRLKTGEVAPPVLVTGKYFVFQVAEKTELDQEKFEGEKSRLEKELTEKKRADYFNAYVEGTLERLRGADAITINQEMVDAMTG